MIKWTLIAFIASLALWSAGRAQAQTDHGFRFVRIQFDDGGGRGGIFRFGSAPWSHDHPTAELNLHTALRRTTEVYVEGEPVVLRLSDTRIFEYPLLYLCEPGYWTLKDDEVDNLREYLERGGFILFDDFGNENELDTLKRQMRKAFPDLEPQEIPNDHPVWSIFFDIDPVEVPSLVGGRGFFSKYDDQYLAYFDNNGRMIALACYNQDIGEGMEFPDRSLGDVSTITFQMGINFIIYALTH